MKIWVKGGLWGIASWVVLFIINGVINMFIHGGKCVVTCASGSGICYSTVSHCFLNSVIHNFFPFNLFYIIAGTQTISQAYLNDYLLNEFSIILINMIIFFIIGTIIGLIVSKVRRKNDK